ncbi:MAG TPA: N-acetylneuraminate synthase [Candidatus Pacebacteria bacterium]|nr:MAG: N-acetylneuraminate synthase [Microgenomates group bacterium GW2011_GWB1_45_17]KKU24800.1 MAG: N-acetylneuraminate synthase [Microgenomates group bacterium GW2011_GWC1_46_15]HAV15446.1 N-acetylneuraminate synthase [Candidatus Paceibacterota bacterium]HCR11495.1 N-acetylneuraminate synthase [Candidatus Paceibacterota bacterium]HCR92956.1 N-acetylneuraminate synthase [Candidatus Paceibacterota bacterium]
MVKNTKVVHIGNVSVGGKHPCFIIAEVGVNHNGSIAIAKKLIKEAKKVGADVVKFQTFVAENIVTRSASTAEYQKVNTKSQQSQFNMLKKLELSEKDFQKLKAYCDKVGIIFMSTPHSSAKDIEVVAKLSPAIKIASGDITNFPFLEHIAKSKKPIIMSTGMSTLKEVKGAVSFVKKYNKNLIVLHCTTNYPTDTSDANLRAMETISKACRVSVGYSDHTANAMTAAVAVAMGACVIEKHFTLDKRMPGPDHRASLEPIEFKTMVQNIRFVETLMGSPTKKPTVSEQKTKKVARKSIVVRIMIRKGERITPRSLIIKRPGTGLASKYLPLVIGRKAAKDLLPDSLVPKEALYWKRKK